jgi:hypothetical protein
MRKFILCFLLLLICTAPAAQAAIQIKKAENVAAKPSGGTDGAASLVPSIIGLVSGIADMSKKQKELSEECIPSSKEITFVNEIMKEWAKTGQSSASELERKMQPRQKCSIKTGVCYEFEAKNLAAGMAISYDFFVGAGNDGMVWEGFPKASIATYNKSDPEITCSGNNCATVSDIYEIFNLVDFVEADYTTSELTMATKLLSKVESCSSARLSAKKKALWSAFLADTVNNMGQKTNTGGIMEQVSAISSGGGGLGSLGSFGSIAAQFMNK